jgi:hypothetical protein
LRIKAFFGLSENAVKTQIWIAIAIYVLVAILKKELKLEQSLHTILQVPSIRPVEKTRILQAFCKNADGIPGTPSHKKLNVFDISLGH